MHWEVFWPALAASLPAILAAVAAFIFSVRNGFKADKAAVNASEAKKELQTATEASAKAMEEIHQNVNGGWIEMKRRLDASRLRADELMAQLQETREKVKWLEEQILLTRPVDKG